MSELGRVEIDWDGRSASIAVDKGAEAGLQLATEYLLAESRKIVPHEEGILEGSGFADVDGLEGSVSYDTPYAVRQHEELTWSHKSGRSAKYLEKPARANQRQIADLIARGMRGSL